MASNNDEVIQLSTCIHNDIISMCIIILQRLRLIFKIHVQLFINNKQMKQVTLLFVHLAQA